MSAMLRSLSAAAPAVARRAGAVANGVATALPASSSSLRPLLSLLSSRPPPASFSAPIRSLHAAAASVRLAAEAAHADASGAPSASAVPSPSSLPPVPLFQHLACASFLARAAVVSGCGPSRRARSYAQLLTAARAVQAQLQRSLGRADLRGERVAILCAPGFSYAAALWGAWLCGAAAVPLHSAHPQAELRYLLQDSQAKVLVAAPEMKEVAEALQRSLAQTGEGESQQTPAGESPSASAPSSSPLRVLVWDPDDAATTATAAEAQPVDYGSAAEFMERRALFIYTSGTTGKPKGVVWSHSMVEFQLSTLARAWGWSAADRVLNVLPLHHVHGLLNVLLCALHAGARCDFLPPAAADGRSRTEQTAAALMDADPDRRLTVFMAVPTIYAQLLSWLRGQPQSLRESFRLRCVSFRLMVSGSAALPLSQLGAWEREAGARLLERYGMSEIGMALSQPLDEAQRRAASGTVGWPLPGVRAKVAPMSADRDDASAAAMEAAQAAAAAQKQSHTSGSDPSAPSAPDSSDPYSAVFTSTSPGPPCPLVGELLVSGPGVFREYWNRPETTAAQFDAEGWFRTGDVVEVTKAVIHGDASGSGSAAAGAESQSGSDSGSTSVSVSGTISASVSGTTSIPAPSSSAPSASSRPLFRLLGRASVDVLKSGGYKISALDVERELTAHAQVEAAAVVGLPDARYGQVVAAVVQLRQQTAARSGTVQGAESAVTDSSTEVDPSAALDPSAPPSAVAADLERWCRLRLGGHAVPRRWRFVEQIPRNAMGKVNKRELAKIFDDDEEQ